MEGDSKVGNPTEVVRFLFLNAHFENLAPCGSVDKKVTNLLHACDWEVWCTILLLKVLVPLDFILVNSHWQVVLE